MKSALKTVLLLAIALCTTLLIQWTLIIGAMPTFTKIAEDIHRPISLPALNLVILAINAVILVAAGELIVRASRRKFITCLLFTVLLFVTGSYVSHEGTRLIFVSEFIVEKIVPEGNVLDTYDTDGNGEVSENEVIEYAASMNPWIFIGANAAEFAFMFLFVYVGAVLYEKLKKQAAQKILKLTVSAFWALSLTGAISLSVYLGFSKSTFLFCAAAILRLVTICKPNLFRRILKLEAAA